MDEREPLPSGADARSPRVTVVPRSSWETGHLGRGLHSSTSRLSVSAFCGLGGEFRGSLGGVQKVSGMFGGVLGCMFCQKRLRLS